MHQPDQDSMMLIVLQPRNHQDTHLDIAVVGLRSCLDARFQY